MKKSLMIILAVAALFALFTSAFAQTVNPVPTLETVRRDGSAVNIYTYRDSAGKTVRVVEYYVNDDGSYGNEDSYYDKDGNVTFCVKTKYAKGECTVTEQRTTYTDDGRSVLNERQITMLPNGKQNILTFTERDASDGGVITTGMSTDEKGRKVYDFTDEFFTDDSNTDITIRTVRYPNKQTSIVTTELYADKTKVEKESTFNKNKKEIHSSYTTYDKDSNVVFSETKYYTYAKNGAYTAECMLVDEKAETMLKFTERQSADGIITTGKGLLMDKYGVKLADYSMEETRNEDGSVVRVETYIDFNGKVDIISKTIDPDGNVTINKMRNFEAAGDPSEDENNESEWESYYDWFVDDTSDDLDAIDNEWVGILEEIDEVWDDDPEEAVEDQNTDDEAEPEEDADALNEGSGDPEDSQWNDGGTESGADDGGPEDDGSEE